MFKNLYFIFLLFPIFVSAGNSAEWEIKAYTSAAPAFIGDHATVISASGETLREGSNGWTCRP